MFHLGELLSALFTYWNLFKSYRQFQRIELVPKIGNATSIRINETLLDSRFATCTHFASYYLTEKRNASTVMYHLKQMNGKYYLETVNDFVTDIVVPPIKVPAVHVVVTKNPNRRWITFDDKCRMNAFSENGERISKHVDKLMTVFANTLYICPFVQSSFVSSDDGEVILGSILLTFSVGGFSTIFKKNLITGKSIQSDHIPFINEVVHELKCDTNLTFCVAIPGPKNIFGGSLAYLIPFKNATDMNLVWRKWDARVPISPGNYWWKAILSGRDYGTFCLASLVLFACSTNHGDTWTRHGYPEIMLNVSYLFWKNLAFDETVQYRLRSIENDQLYISDDFGMNWILAEYLPTLDVLVVSERYCPEEGLYLKLTSDGDWYVSESNSLVLRALPYFLLLLFITFLSWLIWIGIQLCRYKLALKFDFFISYRRSDVAFVDYLYSYLVGWSFWFLVCRVFLDSRALPLGQNFQRKFMEALFVTKRIILVISENSLQRMQVGVHDPMVVDNELLECILGLSFYNRTINLAVEDRVDLIPVFLRCPAQPNAAAHQNVLHFATDLELFAFVNNAANFNVVPTSTLQIANAFLALHGFPLWDEQTTTIASILQAIFVLNGVNTWQLNFQVFHLKEAARLTSSMIMESRQMN